MVGKKMVADQRVAAHKRGLIVNSNLGNYIVLTERELRVEILRRVESLQAEGWTAANYFSEPEVSVARELLAEGLVTGTASSSGVGLTGLCDAGRDFLKAQKPLRKASKTVKRMFIAVYVAIVAICGYILHLDSVKKAISDFVGKHLP